MAQGIPHSSDGAVEREFITEAELAIIWRKSRRTLQRWRIKGIGPRHLQLGHRILYRCADVAAFERKALRGGSSDD